MSEAFAQADNILTTAAKGIAEMITVSQYINVDFEDVKTVMRNSGAAVMGSAKAEGENRALRAAQEALTSPLLNNKNIFGAQKILLSVMSGEKAELQMDEFNEITEYISEKVGDEADLIFGMGTDSTLAESIRVTIIATGFKDEIGVSNHHDFEKKVNTIKPSNEVENPQTVVFNINKSSSMSAVFDEKPSEKKENEKIVFNLDDEGKDESEKYFNSMFSAKSENDWKKDQLSKEADERIEKLRKLSKNIESMESFQEKIEVPAYLRRNIKLSENNSNNESSSDKNVNQFKYTDENSILGTNKFFGDKKE
jgi:cell division protein FtsZ